MRPSVKPGPARSAVALAAALAVLASSAAAAAEDVRLDDAGEWIAADAVLQLRLGQELATRRDLLRVVAGGVDVTALARFPEPGLMHIDPRAAALAPGETELIVYAVEGSTWRELLRTPLKRLTRSGFEKATFTPKLDLAVKSQLAQSTSGSTRPPPRARYADLTARASAGFSAERGGWAFDGQFNGAGSSYRAQALRYSERGASADKFDLADYTLNAKVGDATLSLGHLSYGNNPLLLAGFSSRGVTIAQRWGTRLDVSLNAMNGTSIVGTDNLFGLDNEEHRVLSGTVGLELFQRPGALRAELQFLRASVLSSGNFNSGEIADAEKSHGFGLRLSAASESNRVRGEAIFARSTHVNPFDPQLAQGGSSQAVRPDTANGYSAELSADLLRDAPLAEGGPALTLTALLRHEQVAPLFRSLGASIASDQRASRAGLTAQIGGAQVQLTHQQKQDNLGNLATVLTARTTTSSANASLPLPQWLGEMGQPSLWPTLSLQWQAVHQRALNAPVTADSGIAATHRPDQLTRQHQLGLAWQRERWTWSYGLSHSEQDNRQVGRERADFTNLGHLFSAGWRTTGALNLTAGLQRNRNFSREKDLVSYTNSGNAGFDWVWRERWTLAANVARTLGGDERGLTASANRSAQAQLGYRFEIPSFGLKLPGQVFVRYSEQAATSRDASFGIGTVGGDRSVNAGLSISLF